MMQLNKLKKEQNFFLELVHSNPEVCTSVLLKNPESRMLVNSTSHRIQAYRTSYYARVSSVFSDTIFYLASCLFGKDFIQNFLVQYFYSNPSPAEMTDSVRDFAQFLSEHEEVSACPFLPDFINVCMKMNDILSAPNPNLELLLDAGKKFQLQIKYIYKKSIFLFNQNGQFIKCFVQLKN